MTSFPVIGPGSGGSNHLVDAISEPSSTSDGKSMAPGLTTADFEDDDKGVYELDFDAAKTIEEMKKQERRLRRDDDTGDSAAANRKKGLLAALKGVPKVVGSLDHAIAPMAPVSKANPVVRVCPRISLLTILLPFSIFCFSSSSNNFPRELALAIYTPDYPDFITVAFISDIHRVRKFWNIKKKKTKSIMGGSEPVPENETLPWNLIQI